jgi:hypothetical protein
MRIVSHTAGTNPTRPGVPSIILTVGQIWNHLNNIQILVSTNHSGSGTVNEVF